MISAEPDRMQVDELTRLVESSKEARLRAILRLREPRKRLAFEHATASAGRLLNEIDLTRVVEKDPDMRVGFLLLAHLFPISVFASSIRASARIRSCQ